MFVVYSNVSSKQTNEKVSKAYNVIKTILQLLVVVDTNNLTEHSYFIFILFNF